MLAKLMLLRGRLNFFEHSMAHCWVRFPIPQSVDFEAIIRALRKIEYKGWLTLEANGFTRGLTEDTCVSGLVELYNAAERLEQMLLKG